MGDFMDTFYKILAIYLLVINAVTLFVYYMDKQNAKKKLYRVSEKALITFALVGGSIGALSAMLIFRHKTKHLFFTLGVPLILFLQLTLACFLIFR